MHHTALRFLVGLEPRENLARAHFQLRQAAQAEDGVGDAARGYAVGAPNGEGDVGCGNHPPGNRFAVKQAAVAGLGLERMSDGVPEVEHAPQAAFPLVSGNDFGLQLYGLSDETFELHWITLQDLGPLLLEAQKKIEIADDAALERFIQAGTKLPIRECAQDFRIDEHSTRMM